MTYFGFLAIFLVIPILLLLVWLWRTRQERSQRPWQLNRLAALVIALHVLIALIYTTPWDNYLVATNVWWYDPALVTGIIIGWVPIEEYTFFILQPIFSSLLLLTILQREQRAAMTGSDNRKRLVATALVGVIWLLSVIMLFSGWQPGTYLGLELGWALPPIMLQLIFGADILWHYGRRVLAAVLAPTLYLAAADTLAINTGIWTIDPQQSLHWLIGGILPVEELVFFLLTNTLIVFGVTLSLAPASHQRLQELRSWLASRLPHSRRNVQRSVEY